MANVTVLHGGEDYFIRTGRRDIRARMRHEHPELEIVELDAAYYQKYQLAEAFSASLFSGVKLVEVDNVANANDIFVHDVVGFFAHIPSGSALVLQHAGGNKRKKILDEAKKIGANFVDCKTLTREREKHDFVRRQFQRSKIRITQDGVAALVNALGSDVSALGAATDQLIMDVGNDGAVTDKVVEKYYGGRVEVTVFKVAAATLGGNVAQAVSSFRFAVTTGLDLVYVVAVIASQTRILAKVASYRGDNPTQDLGLASWQIEQARRNLQHWTPQGLARGIRALSHADAQVKGGGEDPEYAVEKAIITLAQARH